VHDSPTPESAAAAALVWFRRVTFIWQCVSELKDSLEARGLALHVLYGRARVEIPRIAQRLLDYDLAANNDGWQWCASTGCDAQSPSEQKARGCLIGRDYPGPIVNHAQARSRTLTRYARARTAHRDRG
jgi:deoxyribodipyrimidine photolyase